MREYEKPRLLSVTAAHVAALEADNAKLRKLARDMDECFRIGALSVKGISRQWCEELFVTYRNRMRELEVEAPE